MDNSLIYVFIFISVLFILYLLRELFCWYFKINERVELLKAIKSKLDDSADLPK